MTGGFCVPKGVSSLPHPGAPPKGRFEQSELRALTEPIASVILFESRGDSVRRLSSITFFGAAGAIPSLIRMGISGAPFG